MKRFLASPIVTAALFALSAVLIVFGGIRAIQAAPRIQSKWYGAEVVLTNIETALVENEIIVEGDDVLLLDSFRTPNGIGPNGENFEVGKVYDEVLKVENVGTIDQFVRVTVTKYWTDAKGNTIKATDLDPDFIQLHFVEDGGWAIDPDASTIERTVLYYTNPNSADGSLAVGERSNMFLDKLSISTDTITAIKALNGSDVYVYDGATFHIKATVDAVQTHNATDAMTGAWGRTN